MPYTLAHPIATAPLWYLSRRRLDLSGLVVGSMMPDISYFIALQPVGNIGHSWQGILLQGILAGFLLLLLFYGIIAQPLHKQLGSLGLHNFPPQQIIGPRGYRLWPLPRLLTILLSISLGAGSHIVWDSFTNHHGWFVERLPLLQQVVLGLPIYKLLQYGGGVVGLVAIALWLISSQPQTDQHQTSRSPNPLPKQSQAIALSLIGLFTLGTGAIALTLHHQPNDAITSLIVTAITGSTSGLFLGLLVYGLLEQTRQWMRHQHN